MIRPHVRVPTPPLRAVRRPREAGRVKPEALPAFFDDLVAWASSRPMRAETLAYGEHGDQVVDLRRPAGRGPFPLVLVLHGGFWRPGFDRSTTKALSVSLVEAGWASANVEYRPNGPWGWRAMLDDVAAARRSLDPMGFPAVVALGHSAGGHLALWLASERLVGGAIALGGVCDLAAAARELLGDSAARELLGGGADDVPDAYQVADPASRLPPGVPQILVHGSDDDRVPVGHARDYAASARAARDDCRVVEIPCGHFEVVDPRSVAWPAILAALHATTP